MRERLAPSECQLLIEMMERLVKVGADAVRLFFRHATLTADSKVVEGFDPVTEGDRAVERALRAVLEHERPNDSIFGEEYGVRPGGSGLTWVIDPIDGTRAFLIGAPTWGTLIAVCDADGPFLGVISQPYTGEVWLGGLGQARLSRGADTVPLQTRAPCRLDQALIASTFPEVGTTSEHQAFRRVADQVKLVRYGLDCYAYGLLAAGHLDLVIEAGLHSYDICGPAAVIEAAGGVVTTWDGGAPHHGGQILAAANPEIHAAAMRALAGPA